MAKQKNKFVFVILTVTVFAMLLTFAACNNQESYKITIHPNNGESDIVWELGDEIPTLKKVGYLFKGFFLDEQFSKEIVLQNLQALDDDCEVWVKWINCPHDIFDENDVCSGCGYFDSGLAFTLNADGESYSVSGIGNFTGTELVIPKVNFDTKPVTSIGDCAFV